MHLQKVSAALVKAQKAFGPALKTSSNPHFKSKYADLSACVEAVIDALNENGIALIQRNIEVPSGVCIETVFVHESGEMLSSGPLHVPAAKQDPQGYGSALTYARRYSLMAACGIAPEDDDGNASVKGLQSERKPVKDTRGDPASIEQAVKDGKAAAVAEYLASLDQSKMDAIWPKLKPETQDAITSAWPG
jgi:ERF superfamily